MSKLPDIYILYHNSDSSVSYLNDCIYSISNVGLQYNKLKAVEGYSEDAVALCDLLNISIAPHYRKLLDSGSKELNNAICATLGHYKIWKEIVRSGRPGIILEHDAILKSKDISLDALNLFKILWLGPRVCKEQDYTYPTDYTSEVIATERFEGVHAYAIDHTTAKLDLIPWIEDSGFTDSIDGFLAMRNTANLTMAVLDPPPVVAVVNRNGDFNSTVGTLAATWNSENYPGFLSGLLVNPPPIRTINFQDDELVSSLKLFLTSQLEVLDGESQNRLLCISKDVGEALYLLTNFYGTWCKDFEVESILGSSTWQKTLAHAHLSDHYYLITNSHILNVKSNNVIPENIINNKNLIYYDAKDDNTNCALMNIRNFIDKSSTVVINNLTDEVKNHLNENLFYRYGCLHVVHSLFV